MTLNFAGKVVLITGASSGIGAATAIRFAKYGAQLAIADPCAEKLCDIAGQCARASLEDCTEPLQLPVDFAKEATVKTLVEQTIAKFSRLDVLINGAGIFENSTIERTTLQQYDRIMNINMRSIYQLTMLAVPELIKTKGNIINISSVCGLRAFPNVLAYNTSKSALDHFTRCVALELGIHGVRCNSVNPGVIITEVHKQSGMDKKSIEEFVDHCKTTHALGRPGEAEEVSGVICFLSSCMASFITGANIPVDGGRHAMCPI